MGAPEGPDREELIRRIQETDPDALRRTATAFETAADELERVLGKLNGLNADIWSMWKGTAGTSFRDYVGQVRTGVGGSDGVLRAMAGHLRDHATAAEDAKDGVRAANGIMGTMQYATPDSIEDIRTSARKAVDGATERFHTSEQSVRRALWNLGELAPGEIPLPALPTWEAKWWQVWKEPPPSWQAPFGEGEPMGYDEDGNLVPAHRAVVPWELELQEAGVVPVGPIVRWLGRGAARGGPAAGRAGAGAADDVAKAVTKSHGWRPGHIDRHIREFYNLADDAPVPAWAKKEFLDLVANSSARSGKVFRWELKGPSQTYATVARDPATKQWIVVQWYANGSRAGEFATAFRPTASQIDRMLRQAAVTP